MLVECDGEETHHALVTTEFGFERTQMLAFDLELEKVVEATFLVLDFIGHFLQAPVLFRYHLGTPRSKEIFKFAYCFLYLLLR